MSQSATYRRFTRRIGQIKRRIRSGPNFQAKQLSGEVMEILADLRRAVAEAGIVGLGGATFPTTIKLNPGLGVSTLILNGVECEPRISCDDALMQNEADHILDGARIMMRILEAEDEVGGVL